jgi:hypothetical protein
METEALTLRPEWKSTSARIATWIGALLLLGWAAFWIETFRRFELVAKADMAFDAWTFLGLDFWHNYRSVQAWFSGVNPYTDGIDSAGSPFSYPPIVLAMFAWCQPLNYQLATAIWTGCIVATVALGAYLVHQSRRANRLPFVPPVLGLALVLWSMPVVFAMERGNYDSIVLLCVIGVTLAWRRTASLSSDALIGGCIAIAAWAKVYPLVLFGVLVLTGRWRALLLAVIAFTLIAVVPYRYTLQFIDASGAAQSQRSDIVGTAVDWVKGKPPRVMRPGAPPIEFSSHSLTSYWTKMWTDARFPAMARIPGLVGAAGLLFPLGAWVAWQFWGSAHRTRWLVAFMLWLLALATFWMPLSYDYNLLFLPLAMWAVWNGRDGWVSNVAMGSAIFWWQPLWLDFRPFSPALVFFLKLASLVVTAQVLVRRLGEAAADEAAAAVNRVDEDGKVLTDVS